MEALKNHTILYDSECPLCDAYTGAFIRTGMLDGGGRSEYACTISQFPLVDRVRARDEIALVNKESGNVYYGIDSLFLILQHRFPAFRTLFEKNWFRKTMTVFYRFISYNRKVIAPPRDFEQPGSCTPGFHLGYRIAYIVFATLIAANILAAYSTLLTPLLGPSDSWRELSICTGQLVWQALVVNSIRRSMRAHYLGNMVTVSLIGGLLLVPMLLINAIVAVDPLVAVGYFFVVVLAMLQMHISRVAKLGMSPWMSFSWVWYRIVVLILIV